MMTQHVLSVATTTGGFRESHQSLDAMTRNLERGVKVRQAYLASREAFFLFSAHRFFIISDRRFLPSGVRRRRFLAGGAGTLATADAFRGVGGNSGPSRASIAVFSRSRSRFNSFTIA